MNAFHPTLAGFWTVGGVEETPPPVINMEPSLDLFFAEDRSLTPRVGPAPLFSRGGPGMRVGSDGFLKWGPENLLLWADDLANPIWVKRAAYSSFVPDNDQTRVNQVVATAADSEHMVFQSQVDFLPYLFSPVALQFLVKKQPNGAYDYMFVDSPDLDLRFSLNVASGLLESSVGEVTSEAKPGGWFLIKCKGKLVSVVGSFRFYLNKTKVLEAEKSVGNGTGILLTKIQLERNESCSAYHVSTDRAYFGPRYTYDPQTKESLGVMFEDEDRTNVLAWNTDFTKDVWLALGGADFGAGSVAKDGVGPDGQRSADRITEAPDGNGKTTISQTVIIEKDASYCLTVFAKLKTRRFISLAVFSGRLCEQVFDLKNGTKGTYSKEVQYANIEPWGNGWFRCVMTFASQDTAAIVEIRYTGGDQTGDTAYPLSGASNWLFLPGLEKGLRPSTPIPTGIQPVVRTQDVMSYPKDLLNTFWNQAEGTIVISHRAMVPEKAAPFMQAVTLVDPLASRIHIGGTPNVDSLEIAVNTNGNEVYVAKGAHPALRTVALAYKVNDFASAVNGVKKTPSLMTPGLPPTVDTLRFGGTQIIARAQVYRVRLPDDELVAVPTP